MSRTDNLARAVKLHQSGNFPEAEKIYRQILVKNPKSHEALYLLGSLAHQTARPQLAEELLRQAVAANPNSPDYQNNLGVILTAQQRHEEAAASYRRAVTLKPQFAEAWFNLGLALSALARLAEAADAYQQSLRIKPDQPGALRNLSLVLSRLGRLKESAEAGQAALKLLPNDAALNSEMSIVLARLGRLDEALTACKRDTELMPDSPVPFSNAGNILRMMGRIDDSIEAYRRAIKLFPNYGEAYSNLGNTQLRMGRLDDAIKSARRAMELDPSQPLFHSNLIFAMCFHDASSAADIFNEARRWDELHGRPVRPLIRPHRNPPGPDRRLKIGYVSSDLRGHVVGWNLLPLLRFHDHENFEISCYHTAVHGTDDTTRQLQAQTDRWRDVTPLDYRALADQIREDGIDILVDLSLHSADNRLVTFAMEPAPVQITYLAYCSTSGLQSMHYRFSDPHLDPPETDLSVYSEQTLRLPRTYWCYEPGGAPPEISPPPSEKTGVITFGCLNQFAKVSGAAIDLWNKILQRVKNSRLLVHAPAGKYLDDVRQRLEQNGVGPHRVEFVERQPWSQYMQSFSRIDIALDPFPYNGGITTCDTLFMGVPVITLSGRTSVGRGGRSILSNLALPELIAHDPDQYVQIAADLSADLPRLAQLRQTLRDRMKSSPLMNPKSFAADVESAYRQTWRDWCSNHR